MEIIAKSSGSVQRTLPPEGNQAARCYQIIHTGTSIDKNYKTTKNKVRIGFELVDPDTRHVFKEGEPARPFVVSKTYNLNLGELSTLRKDLESWRGKAFTEDELKGFDIVKLINAPCFVNVIHKAAESGTTYARITSITSVPKNYKVDDLYNDTFVFSVNKFDQEAFDSLPEFIQEEIMESDEYKAMIAKSGSKKKPNPVVQQDDDADDLPF